TGERGTSDGRAVAVPEGSSVGTASDGSAESPGAADVPAEAAVPEGRADGAAGGAGLAGGGAPGGGGGPPATTGPPGPRTPESWGANATRPETIRIAARMPASRPVRTATLDDMRGRVPADSGMRLGRPEGPPAGGTDGRRRHPKCPASMSRLPWVPLSICSA